MIQKGEDWGLPEYAFRMGEFGIEIPVLRRNGIDLVRTCLVL